MRPALYAQQERMARLGFYKAKVDGLPGPSTDAAINKLLEIVEKATSVSPPRFPNLPLQYAWIEKVPGIPSIVVEALKLLGTVEVPGAGNSPIIMGWRDELNAAGHKIVGYSGDAVPWCGLFMAYVVWKSGRDPVDSPLWADNWRKWGDPAATPRLGDIVTYSREGGNHVAIWIARDRDGYDHVLGGNQKDSVCIMRIKVQGRRTGIRNDYKIGAPAGARDFVVSATGAISTNEA